MGELWGKENVIPGSKNDLQAVVTMVSELVHYHQIGSSSVER